MGNKKEYNQYLWAPEQPRVYETSPLAISGTPMSEEDAVMSLKAENLQQSLQQNPIFKSTKQWAAQQKQREKEIAASKKWLELHPKDDNDDPYTIFERGKHQAIVDDKDPSYYEKMMNDGKQFTKGALTVLSLPYLSAAAAGAYGYGASLGARGLFAAQGIHGLANENGVRKTANLIKSGDYGRAALSGAGDVLNAALVLPGANFLGSAAKYGLKSTVAGDMLRQNVRNAALATSEPLLNVGWGPRQTLKVSRAGEYDQMYFPERWDVVNEGANPHGVWLQGKYGTPRTDLTNPGKGAKAARARNIFSTRSDKYTGTVTLDKPMVTVGEVPNRSSLSYQADNMGADGLIYNGVYDNGYNNNQVILSFRRPELTKIQLSKAERLGIPKGDRGNLSQDQLDALEDLTSYMQSFRRPKLTKTQLSEAEPTYYTYVSGNQSINTLNPNDISGAKLAFESRYPESGVIWRTPVKDQYFGDPITIIGEAPMSQDAKNIAQIMKTRFNRFNIPERDTDYTLFADVQPVRNGPSGAVDKAINTPTKVFIPESAGSNYGGMYQQGIGGFIRLDPGRSKPYKFTQIHEGLSHPTDYNVKWMTPKSSPNKTVESLYEGVSFPKDLFPEEELVQLLGKDSRKWKEGRAVTWEIINDLNNKLAKQSGISSWAQAHAPEQKLWDFIDNTLKTPDDFIKYVKKFDNAYLNDYAKVLEYYKGTPNVEKYFNRIKSALKYLPAVGIPIGMQYISENNQNNVASNTMKQGGILKRVEKAQNGTSIKGKYLGKDYRDYYAYFKSYDNFINSQSYKNITDPKQKILAKNMARYYYNTNPELNDFWELAYHTIPEYNKKMSQYKYNDKYIIDMGEPSYRLKSLDANGNPTNKHTLKMHQNVLDYIYNEAVRGGVNPKTAISIATQESNLGVARQKDSKINAFDLFSYWNGIGDSIYTNAQIVDTYNDLYKKITSDQQLSPKDLQNIQLLKERYNKMNSSIHEYNGDNVVADAVKYFNTGKYNPGDPNYMNTVTSRFDELMNDERFANWWNSKQRFKFGGILKRK